jgi:hypothetical protein
MLVRNRWVPKPDIEAKASSILKVNKGLQNKIRKTEEQIIKKVLASLTLASALLTMSVTEEV